MNIRVNNTVMLFLTYSLVGLISVSCSKDSAKCESKPEYYVKQLIKVSGEDAGTGASTKTSLNGVATSWVEASDRVGIYSPQARTASDGGGSAVVNAPFAAVSSAKKSNFTGTMYWGQANSTHTFYAYYPYTEGSAAATALPVSLSAEQVQSSANSTAHIGALDFLIATPLTITSPASTDAVADEVDLKYNHLFSVVEFQIKGTGALKAVRLITNTTLAFNSGTIDITQSTPAAGTAYTFASQSGTSGEITTTLTAPATLTSTNSDTKVYMVINPGTPTGNCLIGLSSDGATWQYVYKTAPASGFRRGVKYLVSVDAGTVDFYTVTGEAGGIWMDRNLGATRVATSSDDREAYGYYYQWGRGTDGHQISTSGTTATLATGDTPGHGSFITTETSPYDWRTTQNNNLWQVVSGTNNPCPVGFRVPTFTEWDNEHRQWATLNTAGAFSSSLKVPAAGLRYYTDGTVYDTFSEGYYWTNGTTDTRASYLYMNSGSSSMAINYRAFGMSVRCIKD